MTQPTQVSARLHAFDALRAFAFLAVLFAHATLPFTTPVWVGFQDLSSTRPARLVLRETYELLHAFVLPMFFLVSGFLVRRLCVRDGALRMLRSRCQAVLLPLVIGVLTLLPVVHLLRKVGEVRVDRHGCTVWSAIAQAMSEGDLWPQGGPHYLWFLSYLMIFCVLTVLLRQAIHTSAGDALRSALRLDALVAFGCRSYWAPLVLSLPTLVVVLFVRGPIIAEVGMSFLPQPALVVMYWFYFLFGWSMQRTEQHLANLAQVWKWNLASGGLVWLIGTGLLLGVHTEATDFRTPRPLSAQDSMGAPIAAADQLACGSGLGIEPQLALVSAINPGPAFGEVSTIPAPPPAFGVYQSMKVYLSWALTLGAVGLAVRFCTRPMPVVRYLADSSYWVYLAHVPVLMAVQILLADWHVVWWLKLALINAFVLGFLLVVYQYAVQSAWASGLLPVRRPVRAASHAPHYAVAS